MPKFEIELDDHGEFVGQLPSEFSAVLERIRNDENSKGHGKGYQKAATEAKAQIESAIAAEKAKWDATLPQERAKWGEIEETNKHLRTQLEATQQQSRRTMTEREEAHAAEITRRVERETKTGNKIRELVNQNLRAMASQMGARDESLGELEVILQHRIGYDEDMNPFVKDESGNPAKTTAGNLLALDVFVKQYLDAHPHHRKPAAGRGGGAAGGASFHRQGESHVGLDAAKARIESGDRSATAVNDVFNASRKSRAS